MAAPASGPVLSLDGRGSFRSGLAPALARDYGTPLYVYDAGLVAAACDAFASLPSAFGLTVRYAMKANSGRALLRLIRSRGLSFDASSLNEVRRAVACGIEPSAIMLTSQEVHRGADLDDLLRLMRSGLRYCVCSRLQLAGVADAASGGKLPLSVRVHPGVGSGESSTRNTGDKYSCFGVHLSDLPALLQDAAARGILVDGVHVHIGSGGDAAAWEANVDRELDFVERYFPDAAVVDFGGGFRVARMPGEAAADPFALALRVKDRLEAFASRTGRRLRAEIEPGTAIVANSGWVVTRVMDVKRTGSDGFAFAVVDGGMEVLTRPLLYGSRHPFYLVGEDGRLKSAEGALPANAAPYVVVGRCCESGDALTLGEDHRIEERLLAPVEPGDLLVAGGAGAYCSSMSPFNYNSHEQAPEVLLEGDGVPRLVRRRQTLDQLVQNEVE